MHRRLLFPALRAGFEPFPGNAAGLFPSPGAAGGCRHHPRSGQTTAGLGPNHVLQRADSYRSSRAADRFV